MACRSYWYTLTFAIAIIFLVVIQCTDVFASKHNKFLILGAGASGVAVADTLLKAGETNFTIVEARDYIGGRIRSGKINTTTIEIGANWIHHIGPENACWVLKKRFGLSTVEDNYTNLIVRDENGKLVADQDNQYQSIFNQLRTIIKDSYKAADRNEPDIPLSTSMIRAGLIQDTPVENALEYLILDYEMASSPSEGTARQTEVTGTGTDHFVKDPRGYNFLIKELAKNFTDKIMFNTTVTKIHHSSQGVTVETNNNINYTADNVIVTFPNGVLSRRNLFLPDLPQWKYDAISLLPMGHYTKIFLRFPVKFWDSANYALLSNIIRGYYVVWMNLKQTGFFPSENLLLVTVTGSESLRVERLTNDQVKTEVMVVLRKVYGAGIPNPTDLVMSRWSIDPYSYGVYVAPSVGTDSLVYEHMRQPITDNRVWFAGEALDEELFGYTHGAIEVGRQQTSALLKCIDDKVCPVYRKRNSTSCPPAALTGTASTVAKLSLFTLCLLGLAVGAFARVV